MKEDKFVKAVLVSGEHQVHRVGKRHVNIIVEHTAKKVKRYGSVEIQTWYNFKIKWQQNAFPRFQLGICNTTNSSTPIKMSLEEVVDLGLRTYYGSGTPGIKEVKKILDEGNPVSVKKVSKGEWVLANIRRQGLNK